jgi:hypothetical protein
MKKEPSAMSKDVATKPLKVYIELTLAPGKLADILKWVWCIKAIMPILARMSSVIVGYQVHHSSLANVVLMSPNGVRLNKKSPEEDLELEKTSV